MKYMLITNNRKVYNLYRETNEAILLAEGTFVDVISMAKEKVLLGHSLLSDPILSNLTDKKNPFKSIALSSSRYPTDKRSAKVIVSAHTMGKRILDDLGTPTLVKEDEIGYKFIDLAVLNEAVSKFN